MIEDLRLAGREGFLIDWNSHCSHIEPLETFQVQQLNSFRSFVCLQWPMAFATSGHFFRLPHRSRVCMPYKCSTLDSLVMNELLPFKYRCITSTSQASRYGTNSSSIDLLTQRCMTKCTLSRCELLKRAVHAFT